MGYVGEDVAVTATFEHRQKTRRGATCACTHLQHDQLLAGREQRKHHLQRGDHAAVIEGCDDGVLVKWQHRLHRTTGEEQPLVSDAARKHAREVRPASLRQLHLWPEIMVRHKHVSWCGGDVLR